jgi:hypothetical protein
MILVAALGVTLGALPTHTLDAQALRPWRGPLPAIETSYARLRLDGSGGAIRSDGVGVRLMWSSAALRDDAEATTPGRVDLGVYALHTPKRSVREPGFASTLDFASSAFGLAADVRPFAAPLGGRVDPFLSLGAGTFFTQVYHGISRAPSPLLDDSRTVFSLLPGAGLRLHAARGLAVQGSATDVVTFRDGTRHNLATTVGVRLAL